MIEENKPIRIKVTNPLGDELELTAPWDSDAEDFSNIFRTIMFWLSFHIETVNEVLPTGEE